MKLKRMKDWRCNILETANFFVNSIPPACKKYNDYPQLGAKVDLNKNHIMYYFKNLL